MGKVLIIGARGFIGQHVSRAFMERGYVVHTLDPKQHAEEAPHRHFQGTIADRALLISAAAGCDTLVWLGGSLLPGTVVLNLADEVSREIAGAVRAAELCAECGTRRIIFASSGGTVYGIDSKNAITEETVCIPRNAYGVFKLATEHLFRILATNRALRLTILRISNPYGEGQVAARGQGFIAAAFQSIFEGRPLSIWGDGRVNRDFIHVADVAASFTVAATYEGNFTEFNIGSGEGKTLLEAVDQIEVETGLKLSLKFEPGRKVDVRSNILSVCRAYQELGWRPKISFAEGIARAGVWWQQRTSRLPGSQGE